MMKFGKLFYDETYKDDAQLLRNALSEIAEHLGHDPTNPISLSLLCLNLNMSMEVCDLIFLDIVDIFTNGDKMKLRDYEYVKNIMMKHFPEAKHCSLPVVEGFVKAIAKFRFPPLVSHLDATNI